MSGPHNAAADSILIFIDQEKTISLSKPIIDKLLSARLSIFTDLCKSKSQPWEFACEIINFNFHNCVAILIEVIARNCQLSNPHIAPKHDDKHSKATSHEFRFCIFFIASFSGDFAILRCAHKIQLKMFRWERTRSLTASFLSTQWLLTVRSHYVNANSNRLTLIKAHSWVLYVNLIGVNLRAAMIRHR